MQLPHKSAKGEGIAFHTEYGHKHIASQSCAVNVGAAYILINEGYTHQGTHINSSPSHFNHQGIGISHTGVVRVPGKKNTGSHFSSGPKGKSRHPNK
jgi:hypothetical protein